MSMNILTVRHLHYDIELYDNVCKDNHRITFQSTQLLLSMSMK